MRDTAKLTECSGCHEVKECFARLQVVQAPPDDWFCSWECIEAEAHYVVHMDDDEKVDA